MKQFLILILFTLCVSQDSIAAGTVDTAAVDAGLGRSGQVLDGGVYRVAFPRSDLNVTVRGLKLMPGFALGGYAAFVPAAQGTLAVGDLNHLRYEQPHVMYVHFMATGNAGTIASNLRAALALTKTPLGTATKGLPQDLSFRSAIENGLGRTGKVNGKVLSVGVPRAESVEMNGVVVPPAAGVATVMNFQDAGSGNVATTGDFVLVGSEVGPVQQALLAHGIEVTALHSHMIDDSPHLYYMHFWAVGTPGALAAGLKDALSRVSVKP